MGIKTKEFIKIADLTNNGNDGYQIAIGMLFVSHAFDPDGLLSDRASTR